MRAGYSAELVEILSGSGDATDRALVYLQSGDEVVLSALVAVNRALEVVEGVTRKDLSERAARILLSRANERGFMDRDQGQDSLIVTITNAEEWRQAAPQAKGSARKRSDD
jgi:hypothetical protein